MHYNVERTDATGSYGQEFTDLDKAIDYAATGINGRVVEGDGVFMHQEWMFKSGELTSYRIRPADQPPQAISLKP